MADVLRALRHVLERTRTALVGGVTPIMRKNIWDTSAEVGQAAHTLKSHDTDLAKPISTLLEHPTARPAGTDPGTGAATPAIFTPEYLNTSQDIPNPVAMIGPARETDGPGITRAHVLGSRSALEHLPGAASADVDRFLLSDLGPRKLREWTRRASSGEPGFFVARTTTDDIAGFIWVSHRPDGAGQLNAWYVHPKWHGQKVGSGLMRVGLAHLGDVDVYTGTTKGTEAERLYPHYGFIEDVSAPDTARQTPPPMAAHNITAPQVPLVLRRDTRKGDQQSNVLQHPI
ncbi:GNAT family N-acetyltransferase [Nocardia sp. CY41]|uniref:GNAT family N-acetyltransferase n=1 Tax=Nocardia sp. CY41 TaxID=2608686 RepID=UPI00135AD664|nr:GNAT family N-acetyltransferase [Nocardia sp. CY41]